MLRPIAISGVLVAFLALAGCDDDDSNGPSPTSTPAATATSAPATSTPIPATSTPPPTPTAGPSCPNLSTESGPVITYFGLARADDVLVEPTGTTDTGSRLFTRPSGSGFRLVVEGKPGTSGRPVGQSFYQSDLASAADLQIQATRPLGNGSAAVCDRPLPDIPGGGVPAINPPSFEATATNIATLNDFSCRFVEGARVSVDSCVKFLPTEDYHFVDSSSMLQFCVLIDGSMVLPPGDTTLTVRLRDDSCNPGPPAQITVHVGP